ncbi:heat shock protein DnaJ domain protein [Haloterrigena turkmenica DSM 5511]|uniref:Heat shock protein DnaJ domain protein n=1 Tax=Haloterrigena turkmenica (strain ATCC 51198 / DSM 5511 / JCM 9101 / NCIMB 13204 / VKM B-1734 / 4k) TaxID=543526 RepID=D2RS86_HALTV|nr:DnaJ domain-containing protein [Haloterrigena turkmenica]ADB60667.1 heat shock protein DnaJ domain protein [Haloterrigena turkmenica DSM 5511]
MGETYYEVLEVDPDATREEIQTAYRERVLETHPDHNDAPDAAEQFTRISTAKSVLTDGAERARYDRLGHESYVRLADHAGGDGSSDDSSAASDSDAATANESDSSTTGDSSTDASANAAGSRTTQRTNSSTGSKRGRRRTSNRTAADSSRADSGRSGSQRGARTESHHARQRKRRRQQRARRRATSGRSVDDETTASASSTRGGSSATATGADRDSEASASRYAVHDWTDDVDLEWEGQSLEYSTAVTIGCCWLLYPVFVATVLTPVFSIAVSAIVAACTLGLVGYLLTRPRVAAVVFGSWSVLFPVGIYWLAPVSQFSLVGLVALSFAWIPFGYALALWWALRP